MSWLTPMLACTARLAVVAALCAPGCASPARASGPDLCQLPEVLDVVTAHYRREAAHLHLLANTAAEIRTERGRAICAVAVEVLLRDEIRGLPGAVALRQQRDYQVRQLDNGVEVEFGGF